MAYCTLEQLTARFGADVLIDVSWRGDGERPVAPDEAVFTRAIADAEGAIDGFIAGRYGLPLAAVPAVITDLAQAIAIYRAHASVASDKIRKDYDDALKTLRQISDGIVRLAVAGVELAGSGSQGVTATPSSKPLSADTMEGYI